MSHEASLSDRATDIPWRPRHGHVEDNHGSGDAQKAPSPAKEPDLQPVLSIEEGSHHDDVHESQLPYTLIRNLGAGAFGIVTAVKDCNTNLVYALKVCVPTRSNRHRTRDTFKKEVSIIKALNQHAHVIRLYATYTTKTSFGMILTPVADGRDLYYFLGEFMDAKAETDHDEPALQDMVTVLKRAFGCLADGLSFMRNKRIRHKDIKTRNILVHQGLVIYTDFGLSLDWSFCENAETSGPAEMTRKYAAPEVVKGAVRDSSSDVFSLGCVFIEILSALCPTVEYDERDNFSDVIKSLQTHIKKTELPQDFAFLPDIILWMTAHEHQDRCSAERASKVLSSHHGFSCERCRSSITGTTAEPQQHSSFSTHIMPNHAISIRRGTHHVFREGEKFEYLHVSNLGAGSMGIVTEVRDPLTGACYACKKYRFRSRRHLAEGLDIIENEMRIIRDLGKHRHIIKLIATFSDKRDIGLIMLPVADQGDLDGCMMRYQENRENDEASDSMAQMKSTFERAFGCLASGLAYLHSQRIRHKDISPRNILIHQGNVIYSGFDSSLNTSDQSGSVTTGVPSRAGTRYTAPEVLAHEPRNSKSDVYSLGCVFLDILHVLEPSTQSSRMATEPRSLHTLLGRLALRRLDHSHEYRFLYDVVRRMTYANSADRSTAQTIATTLAAHTGYCCDACREEFKEQDD